jgi:hypothetical protein
LNSRENLLENNPMNSKTYLKLIAERYGGLMRPELEERLTRLVEMAKREQYMTKQLEVKQVVNSTNQPPVEKPVENTRIVSYQSDYEKAMNLIRSLNNRGWKHIEEVPPELFKDFWAIAEMHPEIIFDEDRQWQYFKVEDFKSRSFLDRKQVVRVA